MKLNVFLFKSDVGSFDDCLLPQTSTRRYEPIHPENATGTFEYEVYLIRGNSKPPGWLKFLGNHINQSAVDNIANRSNSAVILIKAPAGEEDRYFAVSCGYGYHILDKERTEPNFGLVTTLNSVDPKKIRSVDSKNVGVQTFQKKEASNLETSLGDFGFDFDSEILRIVSGVCSDKSVGTRIGGSDNLHLNADVTFSELGAKCGSLYTIFKKDTYKTAGFDFIDSMKFVTDISLISELDTALVQAVNDRQDDFKIAVAYPDQIDYERCDHYSIKGFGDELPCDDVRLSNVYELLGDIAINVDDLKRKVRVTGYEDALDTACTRAEPLYSYFAFETDQDNKRFVLTNGKWYCVNEDYVKQVEDYLRSHLGTYDQNPLKPWEKCLNKKGMMCHDEGHYNSCYQLEADYLHLDGQLFRRGHGKIEVADFYYRPDNKLYCVKKLNRSSTLSHLFAQGSVSAELFKEETAYCDSFLQQLSQKWPSHTFDRDGINNLVFVYAMGTEKTDDLISLLPLFSKINLRKHARMITRMGFGLKLARVQMVETQSNTGAQGNGINL